LGERARDDDNVASVREREALRRSAGSLEGRRIVVTEPGGLDALTAAIGGALRNAGAVVLTVHHPDGSEQAAQANGVAADVFVGFATHDDADCVTAYYKAPGYESSGGRRLADCLQAELAKVTGQPARDPDGMAVPALRETRMPAVLCELGPPELVVAHGPAVAEAVCDALTCWLRTLDQT
jgi:N-acetylmuramoyl-L-alanine amidase